MKEATGELNMTVVTVVAIAAVAAFFYAFVWPGIKASIQRNTICANAICNECDGKTCTCTYIDEAGETQTGYKCPDNSGSGNTTSGGTPSTTPTTTG